MRKVQQQRGAGILQLVFTLLMLALLARAAIVLVPIYLERKSVESMLAASADTIATRGDGKAALMRDIESKFSINGIDHPTIKQVKVRSEGRGYTLVADYDVQSNFLFNIDILVKFQEIRIDVSSIALN